MVGFKRKVQGRRPARIAGTMIVGLALAAVLISGISIGRASTLGLTVAAEAGTPGPTREGRKQTALYLWSATSPATHVGDQYQLVLTNSGSTAQEVVVRTAIMDHRQHKNTVVLEKELQLAPGEQQTFTAANEYGTANHFVTHLGSETQDLTLQVTITDTTGAETARFTQGAFMVKDRKTLGEERAQKRQDRQNQREGNKPGREKRKHHRSNDGTMMPGMATPAVG